ncbi:MAG: glycoside hydrolase family 2 protein [Armatimonadota bacterium]
MGHRIAMYLAPRGMVVGLLLGLGAYAAAATASSGDIPWPEHPRPDFRRDQWLNLNGEWQFDFDPDNAGEREAWHEPGEHAFSRKIVVPFPWEAKLSGIGDTEYRGVAWYSRKATVPARWQGKRVWLCFGAVDWAAQVWVNGQPMGEHVGGYTPFAFDITDAAGPGEQAHVIVRAEDFTSDEQPTGKQTGWYTRTSGIWQTVYLEARGEAYVDQFRLVTQLRDGGAAVQVSVELGGRTAGATVQAKLAGQTSPLGPPDADGVCRGTIELARPRLWSCDDPHLYDMVLAVKRGGRASDRVRTYLGVSEISVAKAPGRDYTYIHLNGKPIYLRGDLHQSFHPDGIYQYPDDRTMRWDYEYAKRIGINFLRIHIKSEIPRALYWADKLGVLIMEDQPNFRRYTDTSRRNWELVLRETVARDLNHPSIIAWCNFNETWGIGDGGYNKEHQSWVRSMYELTKQLDPTRLVEDNSANRRDHVATDINSWHFYINDYDRAREHIADVVAQTYPGSEFNYAEGLRQTDAPLINSEYGGISAGKGDQDISWCFKYLTNELRKHDKICGYVYTEQSDIEWEHNGFLNYDRTEKVYGYDYWFPGFTLADLNRPDFLVLDAEPCPVLKPGGTLSVPALISHWSDREEGELTLHWRLDYLDRWGRRHERATEGSRPLRWEQYRVVPAGTIEVRMPDEGPAVGVLRAWVSGASGRRLAANYINVHVDRPAPRGEVVDRRRVALRFAPNEVSAWEWGAGATQLPGGRARDKLFARGHGYLEYELALPQEIPTEQLSSVSLLLEASAKAGDERLAWPARKKPVDYPQSDKEFQWPTELVVSIQGQQVERTTLPDDPADARGVLSHRYGFHPGSYGWLVHAQLESNEHSQALAAIRRSRRITIRLEVPQSAKKRGGLAVFGERLGRYPTDPTVILQYDGGHGLGPEDLAIESSIARRRVLSSRGTVIATAEERPTEWRYTTQRPPDRWTAADFDDGSWATGRGGFGTAGTPNAIVNTPWRTENIWLRKRFDVERPDEVVGATLRLYHDEDVSVYLNGTQIVSRRGYVTEYVEEALNPEALGLLRASGNVLAVHCRQTRGGQNIDVGLSVARRSR